MTTPHHPILEVQNLHTTLTVPGQKPIRAVDGISIQLKRGETFALLGESGSGKSIAALSLMRLLPTIGCITEGDVILDGTSLLALPESIMRTVRGRRIGMIFQEPMSSLNPVMSVGDQVTEAVKLHDPTVKPATRVIELFTSVGIPDPARRLHEYPHQLSGGLKQRVMIAMALAGRPEILIADEPTTALDVTIQAQVLAVLKQIQHDTGMALLLITHDLGVAAEMADQVAIMYAGQIVERASATAFFKEQQHPYSRQLMAALPNAQKRQQGLAVIPGMVPTLDQTFPGCRFVERCAQAKQNCKTELPPWHTLGEHPQQGYSCHIPIRTETHRSKITQANQKRRLDPENLKPKQEGKSAVLEVVELCLHFPIRRGVLRRVVGQVKAVDGVNLEIAPRQTLALVGESGCGKTTVGKTILQLLQATSGQVKFEGRRIDTLKGAERRKLGSEIQMIFQDPASSMNPRLRVADIIQEGMQAQQIGGTKAVRQARITTLLEQVGLPDSAMQRYPHEFSGGQRQRIAIARALAVSPRLLVCDEPTSALDVSVQAQVLNLLKKLQQELSLSYLFITHNISVVAYLADRVAVMYLGRIVEQGTVEQVLRKPKHPYTQALLAAVPDPVPNAMRETFVPLMGELPSPANPPTGCHFHARCPKAEARCREKYPPTLQQPNAHQVACWLYA